MTDALFSVHGKPVDLEYVIDAMRAVGIVRFLELNEWARELIEETEIQKWTRQQLEILRLEHDSNMALIKKESREQTERMREFYRQSLESLPAELHDQIEPTIDELMKQVARAQSSSRFFSIAIGLPYRVDTRTSICARASNPRRSK